MLGEGFACYMMNGRVLGLSAMFIPPWCRTTITAAPETMLGGYCRAVGG